MLLQPVLTVFAISLICMYIAQHARKCRCKLEIRDIKYIEFTRWSFLHFGKYEINVFYEVFQKRKRSLFFYFQFTFFCFNEWNLITQCHKQVWMPNKYYIFHMLSICVFFRYAERRVMMEISELYRLKLILSFKIKLKVCNISINSQVWIMIKLILAVS